nr:DNA methyltransferase [Metamycoplasma orale]
MMYSKNITKLITNVYEDDLQNSDYNLKDQYYKTRGMYKLNQLDRASLTWSEGLDYIIEYENKKYYAGGSLEQYKNRHNGKHAIKDWQWRWSKEKFEWGLKNDFIVFKNNKIYTKQYQFVDNNDNQIKRRHKFSNLIINHHGTQGTSEQKDLFINKIFDHPKPTNLIKYLINLNPNKNARILDFFAGSGTTGHATLELNREDGGSRTYTLVTNDENNIGSNVTYERLYRINNGKGTKGETDFKCLEKNEPYKQNLNVYSIEYFDASINNPEKDETDDISLKLLKKLNDLLNSFNLKSIDINSQEKINILTELNALDKKEITNESK